MRPILTSRLSTRRFREADLEAVVRLYDECFGAGPRQGRVEWLDWTVRNYRALEQLRQPPYGDYAVTLREGGEVVGAVGLVPCLGPFERLDSLRARGGGVGTGEWFTPEVGLFWAVSPAHRRLGYASEAAAGLAKFAFEELRVERVVAMTEHSNGASIGVMRRLGMSLERNPREEPTWFQTVGVLFNPGPAAPARG